MGESYFYKGVRVNAFGIPLIFLDQNKIKNTKRKKSFYYINFHSEFKSNSPKNLIVMYDIPHNHKKERDWFRRQLIKFGYIMIQKSVWVGPSPLPKDFLDYVKFLGLKKHIKTFKLARAYNSHK